MSFGGGFGGFGSNNNNNTQSGGGFGGFGANNNINSTSGGFGSNTGTSIFGSSNNTGSTMFGSNTGNTGSPFGGGGTSGGFGSNNNSTTFGSKPFGSSTGTGLFGGGGTSSGSTFGGFGSNNNTSTTTPAFGSNNNTGAGLFGQNKPASGFGASSGGGLFGSGSTGGGFGSGATNNTTTGGFGASATSGFGNQGNQQPNNGTASTPFQAFSEKDSASSNQTSQYQTITFQQPYTNYSLEELRTVDYNQGRRYGNQNGQAGAFGQNTGFGGFGSNNNTSITTSAFGNANTNTGGSLFGGGANTNTTSTFGQNTGSTFGSNTNTNTGGLFSQSKPATGGLFGSSSTTPATGTTGGLFGGGSTNTATTGGFGSGAGFGSAATGGGLFGNNNQNQQKPGGLFGGTTTASTGFGGGATNTGSTFGQAATGGGLFGQNNATSAPSAFGANPASTNTGGGLFGNSGSTFGQNNQNQAQAQPASGGLFGGFGQNNQQNQPKPGGLFGGASATNTGGGLFGQQNNAPQQTGGLFGGSTLNNTGGGLFGQKAAAPSTGGLFGGSTANTGATAGGLFGNVGAQNTQQNTGGGLFGGQNNQQKPGGLFGGSTQNTNTGGSLFGGMNQNNNQPNLGGSLFSSQNNQQQNQQPNNNSLFGASGSSLLNTSMNTNPYGNDALFSGLATPTQSPGPLATPLSSSQKNKKSAILPQHKLNPSASTRLLTPQNKRTGGYGFTYSTYGTPNSVSSQNSPGLGGSLFSAGSLSRSLGKSLSTSNLRNSFTPETSILSPGAFSVSGRSYGNGSLKKLNVNRSLNTRIPLFDDPPQKRVSFAGGENETTNGTTNGETALVVRRDDGDVSPQRANSDSGMETPRPAPEKVNGSQLARVSEDSALTPKSSSSVNIQPGQEPKAGSYWSSPTLDQLKRMSKQELKSVPNFVVGRHNVGQISFNMGKPVDLSDVNLDLLFGDIVQLNARNATVYGADCSALPKPALGTALNQPSEIVLGNSWPRNRAGKKDVKHLERLKRVGGTTFVKYNQANGEWTFTVPHFSSYGLDYDDYSDDEDSSELSPVPDTPAQPQLRSSQMSSTPQEESFASPTQSSPDDTFDFKKGMRSRASVPGGYGDEVAYEEDEEMEDTHGQSFLGQRSVGSLDGQQDGDYSREGESEVTGEQDMADPESSPFQTTEQATAKGLDLFKGSLKPKSILKASQVLRPGLGTPGKGHPPIFDDDWANQLQRTISPKKQDRQALRESQGNALRENSGSTADMSQSVNGRNITTAMDLMESLFGETEKQKLPKRVGNGIELPYSKRPKTADDLNELARPDQDFHSCSKPHFSENGVLIYGNKGPVTLEGGIYPTAQEPLVGATKDIRFTQMPSFDDSVPATLALQKQHTKISIADGVPSAMLKTDPDPIEFSDMAKAVAIETTAGAHEQHAWQLLSLLFDEADKIPNGVDEAHVKLYRKEQLSEFWKLLVWDDAQAHVQDAASPEEKAIAHLSCNNVAEACHSLLSGLDLRLATMVAQIGGDAMMRQSLFAQLEEWRRLDVLSEMEDSHRAIYELLSGNCAQSEGKTGSGRENKASTFGISSRFALDWRRSFGLRLWYGIMTNESIEWAVAQFADAIRDGLEDVKPVPWFIEAGADSTTWNDPYAEDREDLLWGILKLYASSKLELDTNIEDVLSPENISGHPLNARLAFQLFQLFKSRQDDQTEADERKVGMPTIRGQDEGQYRSSFQSSTASCFDKDAQAMNPLVELGDKITLTYAASLHTPAHWTTAVWVYAHLSSRAMREHYIKVLVSQFSNTYSLEELDSTYIYLTRELLVPTTWLHAAAALQAKSEGDTLSQATHLIKAEEPEEAHDVLRRKVGPDAIISRDYDPLRELMGGFLPTPTNSPTSDRASFASSSFGRRKEPVQGWSQGGQIYFDYIELLDLTGQRSTYRVDEDLNSRIQELLTKLQRALEIAARDRLAGCGLEERVALMEIAGTVAGLVTKTPGANRAAVMKLPLTEDLRLKHTCALSAGYYRSVMKSDH
ncbi:nuclear protein 96-domain-containing protein [Phaeosphaeriaceae sp. PMI808]|nr:nuclear protein 96-domain-containing protein [Phaeosphaeriaceae sp. PMI808]